jgi:hypothetical protein
LPSPIVYGSYLAGLRDSAGVRRDFARMLRAADPRDTVRAAELLKSFDKPALSDLHTCRGRRCDTFASASIR